MKELVWDDTLSVDVNEIDEDHRRLVELFNILNRAIEDGDSTDYIESILDELISCTVWHFKHEERLMMKHGYSGFEEHKAEHQSLIDSATALQKKFLEGGKQISSDDIAFLEHWLTSHIYGTDMEMGAYLSQVM